jgi:hypothetical protein
MRHIRCSGVTVKKAYLLATTSLYLIYNTILKQKEISFMVQAESP